jgi:hypothetical protein
VQNTLLGLFISVLYFIHVTLAHISTVQSGNMSYIEESRLLGYNAMYSVEIQPKTRMNGSENSAATCFMFVSCLVPTVCWILFWFTFRPSRRKCYSEMSVDLQRTSRRYSLEDRTIRNHRREGLKSY